MREDVTNRIFVQSSYDFSYVYRHSVSVNVSTSNRDDQTKQNTDSKNSTASLAFTTHWKEEFQTSLNALLSLNRLPVKGNFNYQTILLGARHLFLEHKLSVSATGGTTIGDFKRTQFGANAEYLAWQVVRFSADFTLLHNANSPTDVLWSFMIKYNM